MVFGRLLRSPVPQERIQDAKVQEPKTKWFQDQAFLEPATAPSRQEPEEAVSDSDWDWDMPEASQADDAVGALVMDDYLLLESMTSSSVQLREEDVSSPEESTPKCQDMSASLPSLDNVEEPAKAASEVSTEEPPADPHTADGAAGPAAEVAAAGLTAAVPDEEGVKETEKHGYICHVCDTLIFKEEDILSSNYHAMTGPGYLTSTATNVCIALELQTQLYTTGKYTVREVSCSNCAAMLGVTYAGAADVRNRYKVGKFLLGRDRLCLPPGVVHPMDQK